MSLCVFVCVRCFVLVCAFLCFFVLCVLGLCFFVFFCAFLIFFNCIAVLFCVFLCFFFLWFSIVAQLYWRAFFSVCVCVL